MVAEVDGHVVGHIAFSPVTMSDGTNDWYGLGSVSVHPDFQHEGIGKALIHEGLSRLKTLKQKVAAWSGIHNITGNLGLRMLKDLSTRAFPRKYSSFFHLTEIFHRDMSRFMKHSKLMANKTLQRMADCNRRVLALLFVCI